MNTTCTTRIETTPATTIGQLDRRTVHCDNCGPIWRGHPYKTAVYQATSHECDPNQ